MLASTHHNPFFFHNAQKHRCFSHNSFTTLPHDSPLNSSFTLLFYCATKNLLGSAKCSARVWHELTVILQKKKLLHYLSVLPYLSACLTYLLCLPVTFRAHIQVFCGRACTIFLQICILQQKSLILGNVEPAAEGVVWLKVFAVLFSCYFWRVLWFCFFLLHCFLLNLILFVHVAKNGFEQQWRILL